MGRWGCVCPSPASLASLWKESKLIKKKKKSCVVGECPGGSSFVFPFSEVHFPGPSVDVGSFLTAEVLLAQQSSRIEQLSSKKPEIVGNCMT